MKLIRHAYFPSLLAIVLLLVQQGGIGHALQHALENNTHQQKQSQTEQQMPHSKFCAQCAAYTQSGTALSGIVQQGVMPAMQFSVARYYRTIFCSMPPQAASARGPPALFHKIV